MSSVINNKGQTDIIFLDFSKAFDKISHKFMVSKLHYYGIRNHKLSWIGAFLSNRTQTTVVNGAHTSYVEATYGVPQGSVLGPMLFLVYINDIDNAITSQIKLFADDSVLCRNIHSQNDQKAPAHTPCLFSIDLHTVRQHLVIVHFLLLLLLSGTLFQMMSGVPHHCHHLSLV